ncbi:hypothetical protein KUL97_04745 [Synechococcus sp. HK05]|uniref:hypothetical protein n=1 Tax=Synechococcus sp. HK05 TaxID=2725975 RepID=UPI001C38086B|nr:hypothetical protein [Synechococcus sp. HK05]MBV2351015.1 hypothetical protein [Synechococcus sp. HK05]
MRRIYLVTTLTGALLLLMPLAAEAKTTRTFSGSNPGEVEKNARKAGFNYPEGEMKCSSRCEQRWAKE